MDVQGDLNLRFMPMFAGGDPIFYCNMLSCGRGSFTRETIYLTSCLLSCTPSGLKKVYSTREWFSKIFSDFFFPF